MTTQKSKILLVDDHPMLRNGLKQWLSFEDDMEVIAEASNGHEALELASGLSPDLIVLDLNLPGMSGLQVLQQLRQQSYRGKVAVFSVSNDPNDVNQCIRAGANAYLLKDMEPEEIAGKLRDCLVGISTVSSDLKDATDRYLENQKNSPASQFNALSDRERDVLRQIVEGLSNKEIARNLTISEGTVKVHVKHLLAKLEMKSRVEAAVWVVENKLQDY